MFPTLTSPMLLRPMQPTSIFPQFNPDIMKYFQQMYQQNVLMAAAANMQKMKMYSSPEATSDCVSRESSTEKPKFDFTHLAESIETEERERAAKIVTTPPRPVSMAGTPYGNAPWFLVPGRRNGPGRVRPKKEFICSHCQRHFTKSYNLLIHERTHTDERPYPCEICSKRFRRQDHLRDHRFIHSKEKPFKCEVCGKGFCQARTLQTHRETHKDDDEPNTTPLVVPSPSSEKSTDAKSSPRSTP